MMSRQRMVGLVGAAVMVASMFGGAVSGANSATGAVRAGVADVDLSWNVGRNQGQLGPAGNAATGDQYDPFLHTTTQEPTQGIQARLSTRALVVEGPDGTRVAYLKNDHYLQQDTLHRRVSQLVEEANIGIDREHLMIGSTHNHSAPFGATMSWGVMAFADAFDAREFDYFARGMADAVIQAADALREVRVGASVGLLSEVQQNILGPATADDGTPAGFPRDHFDPELAVVRFDDITDPDAPTPYAALVNLGMHPESLDGNGFTSPDFVGMVENIVDRATGAVTVWSQGGLGDVEPDRTRANGPDARAEFWRRDFAQAERMSRVVADRVLQTWQDVEDGVSPVPGKHIPFSSSFDVDMIDISFPGPASHPVPTVSNCRTDEASEGNIGVPVVGLPDCSRQDVGPDVRGVYDAARDAGIPVTENYGSVPGYMGAQETVHAHLQVMRLGDIVLAACPCEPVTDMVLNFKTRADATEPDMHLGWLPTCVDLGDGTYECERPNNAWQAPQKLIVPAERYERMMAQITNDAAGWDAEDPESIMRAEAEPTDPDEIKGNFTHERITDLDCGGSPCAGYRLPLVVGTANDYVGYIVTYREYMRGDHYRKALTAFGPHTADYMNTRFVRMAAALQGADAVAEELLAQTVTAEHAYLDARARAIGEAAAASRTGYEVVLPDDGGTPAVTLEPAEQVARYDAAQLRWIGGSNYSDDPRVRVERNDGGEWVPVADQHGGEVVTTVEYRSFRDPDAHTSFASGDLEWHWTATWEAFDETQLGEYRFVVEGFHRSGGAANQYELTSRSFEVVNSGGLTPLPSDGFAAAIPDGQQDGYFPQVDEDGTARFRMYYPDTYSPVGVPYISGSYQVQAGELYCFRCTFRAWRLQMSTGEVIVTVRHDGGATSTYPATFDGSHWVATGLALGTGDEVWIEAGEAVDDRGDTNGTAIRLA